MFGIRRKLNYDFTEKRATKIQIKTNKLKKLMDLYLILFMVKQQQQPTTNKQSKNKPTIN